MRTIKELLQVMLDNKELFITGLCNWNYTLRRRNIITIEESNYIESYINKHPTRSYRLSGSIYYWEPYNIKPRIRWLERHIKLQE